MSSSKKNSIKIALRIKPINNKENNITTIQDNSIFINNSNLSNQKKFIFDFVYDTNTDQNTIYEDIGSNIINNTYEGYNSCIFAYGQTGCFELGTRIMMYDGMYKNVEDVEINDEIMGDDSTVRIVKKLFRGIQNMYKIYSNSYGFDSYVVNEDHILVLLVVPNANVKYVDDAWSVVWFDGKSINSRKFPEIEAKKFAEYINTNDKIVEMSVKDFISLPTYKKYSYKCITTKVEFKYIETKLDPYFIGLLLGNISKHSIKIKTKNSFISSYLESFSLKHRNCLLYENKTYSINPNSYIYNIQRCILYEKVIPVEYLINSKSMRLKLLAGLIDSSGSYEIHNDSFTILQYNISIFNDIIFLLKSLGYVVSSSTCVIDKDIYNICYFQCYNSKEIPILIPKIIKNSYKSEMKEKYNIYTPMIKNMGIGNYYGFMINANNRFIGAGFNILRNSGKTFTMTGTPQKEGLIPRIYKDIFKKRVYNKGQISFSYKIEISYIEIYSEQVRDLISTGTNINLKIRQHPETGPYVEGLTKILVEDVQAIKKLIDKGNKERTIATTLMNNKSSRSHAILTIYFTKIITEPGIGKDREMLSKINLVDLAGSEKVEMSGVTGINFKEAISINKSLSNLGLVISKLAQQSKFNSKTKKRSGSVDIDIKNNNLDYHIPFRDSALTWILSESLGGNSKTYMIATISPSGKNYNESLSTLRYAYNAKQIINTVKINEDTNEKIVKILKEEIENLKLQIKGSESKEMDNLKVEILYLRDAILQREDLMKEREKSWEQKLQESIEITTNVNTQMEELKEKEEIAMNESNSELKNYYNKKIEDVKLQNIKDLEKKDKDTMEEIKKLKDNNNNLKYELDIVQTTLKKQLNQFNTDRAVLSKQIQQLQSK